MKCLQKYIHFINKKEIKIINSSGPLKNVNLTDTTFDFNLQVNVEIIIIIFHY